jgi:hypothetical protein
MPIIGLDPSHTPFKYLDEYVTPPDWELLHNEVCLGIAKSLWHKKYVSSGVHDLWAEQEITTSIVDAKNRLTPAQFQAFLPLDVDQRIKYMNALLYCPHPFWIVFIKNNKRVEFTGVFNKSVANDCEWTDDAVHFPMLIKFIETLPFESIGRILFFMTEANNQTVPHFDVLTKEQRAIKPHDDFIWFTTKSESKSMFVMDGETLERTYPDPTKRFVWFNEMDYHGTEPVPHFSFSVRIDGKFKPEVKAALTKG